MHNTDKILRYATGLLTRTRNRVAIDPCPAAVNLIAVIRNYGIHFSYSERLCALHAICTVLKCATLKPTIDKNKTRISPLRNLFLSLLRMTPALKQYRCINPDIAVAQVTNEQFQTAAEIEAVAVVVANVTTLAQTENGFAGGYKAVLYQQLGSSMHPVTGTLKVLDISNMTAAAKPPRRSMTELDVTPLGKLVWYRAYAEVARRIQLPGASISTADLIAFGQDIRLLAHANRILSPGGAASMKKLTQDEYVAYAVNVRRMEHTARSSATSDATHTADATPAGTSKNPVGIDVSDDSDDADGTVFDVEMATSTAIVEFNRVWPNWTRYAMKVHWPTFIPGLQEKSFLQYDLVYDLLDAPMGQIYLQLEALDKGGRKFGLMPKFSTTRIGNLLASSCCERMISAANLVMPKGRTVLDDQFLFKVVLLKMNRKFMEHMKARHPELAKQMLDRYEAALIAHMARATTETPAQEPGAPVDPAVAADMSAEVMDFAHRYFANANVDPAASDDVPSAEDELYRIIEDTNLSEYDGMDFASSFQGSYDP